jgi:hypothetical protein
MTHFLGMRPYITIQIADALMKHNEYFAFFAKELMQKGKSKNCACIATGARFMRVAFCMINDQKPFEPSNGLGISKDPLTKIKTFLQNRQSSEMIEQYLSCAKQYFTNRETSI